MTARKSAAKKSSKRPAGPKAQPKTKTARPKPKAPTPSTSALNERQHKFAMEYLVDPNATQAALRAGYSAKTAYSQGQRLLKNAEVQAIIGKERAALAKRRRRTVDGVLERLESHSDGAAASGQYSAAIRAEELIGKHLGMFTHDDLPPPPPAGDVNVTVNVNPREDQLKSMSEEEQDAIAAAVVARIAREASADPAGGPAGGG